MTNVSESIPLSPTLSIEMIYIVVGNILSQRLDLVFEALAGKGWSLGVVQ